ncbi:MAG: metallophosphoesterase [Sedimentisphaerales bacterium]|nr:metallophosphoesterase [Sedimentisphaerales bacterium]
MLKINHRRELVEQEGRLHAIKRGKRGKFHFENMPWLKCLLKVIPKLIFVGELGRKNVLDIITEHVEVKLINLPDEFDEMVILFITDLHIDCMDELGEEILAAIRGHHYDFCILGGDYSFGWGRDNEKARKLMEVIIRQIKSNGEVFAVLGNHDRFSMAQALDGFGVRMLLNDHVCLRKGDNSVFLVGLDDCHYFGADDLDSAVAGVSKNSLKILISHSPEIYEKAEAYGFDLLLSGHTHGGQICLPNGTAIVKNASVPSVFVKGKWSYKGLRGYTSRGAGSSCIPARFFCPPEITFLTLKKL